VVKRKPRNSDSVVWTDLLGFIRHLFPLSDCHALMVEADCSFVTSCTVLQLDQLWNCVKIYENAHLNADGTTVPVFSAIHITHNLTRRMQYSSMLLHVNLDSLAARTEDLSRRFFVILLILPPVFTTSFLHPDPPLSHLG